MQRSQNGYRANDRDLIKYWRVGKNQVLLSSRKGDVQTVMHYVADRYDREVHTLVQKNGQWGYAERNIRGSSTTLSNHASGTAIDLDAALHPLGTNPRSNYSRKQIKAIHRIVRDCDGVIRWGGDYHGRKDGMHFEINAGPSAVSKLAKKIKATGAAAPAMGDDDLKEYSSAAVTKTLALPANKWSNIPWDKIHAGPMKAGKPGIILSGGKYDAKVRFRLEGLPKGANYKVRFVEAHKNSKGEWVVDDNAAQQDETMTAGDDYKTLVSGPDSLGKGHHLWFQVNPGNANAKLVEAYVKAFQF